MTQVLRVKDHPYVVKIDLDWEPDGTDTIPDKRKTAFESGLFEPVCCQASALVEVETKSGIIYEQHFYTEISKQVDNDTEDTERVAKIEKETMGSMRDLLEAFRFVWPGTPDYKSPKL